MKCLLSVCLAIAAGSAAYVLQNEAKTLTLRPGVSVQMAVTQNAVAVPAADEEGAWVVTVTRNGDVFFGLEKFSSQELLDKMKQTPHNRAAKLYLKADAGAPFSSVRQVLHAARLDLFGDVVLLTSQPEASQPGMIVAPKGLQVWIGPEAGSNFVTVQVDFHQGSPILRVNNEFVAQPVLQQRLAEIFDNRDGRIVVLKVAGQVPYAQVVHAIDACRAAGATRISIRVSSVV